MLPESYGAHALPLAFQSNALVRHQLQSWTSPASRAVQRESPLLRHSRLSMQSRFDGVLPFSSQRQAPAKKTREKKTYLSSGRTTWAETVGIDLDLGMEEAWVGTEREVERGQSNEALHPAAGVRGPAAALMMLFLLGFAAEHWGSMRYMELHLFLVLPELYFRCLCSPLPWASERVRQVGLWTTLPLCVAAITFSSIWDNYIFSHGVFTFDKSQMLGTLGALPLEEWFWFVDHTTFASTIALSVMGPRTRAELAASNLEARTIETTGVQSNQLMAGACGAVSMAGFWTMANADQHYLFLGVCMGFMPPLLALQGWFGKHILRARPREWLGSIAAVSSYVIALDLMAREQGIWHLNPDYVTGLKAFSANVPLEQLLIYTLPTMLVVQTNIFVVRLAEAYEVAREEGGGGLQGWRGLALFLSDALPLGERVRGTMLALVDKLEPPTDAS